MTAIKAAFSDFRIVKGRKVAQFVMETPLEEANAALQALGGVPQPDASLWVGIAPLTEEAATRAPDKPRKRFSDMSRAQQAGILAGTGQFHAFLSENYRDIPGEAVPDEIRRITGVVSRALFDEYEDAGKRWDMLRTEYDAWRGAIGRPE